MGTTKVDLPPKAPQSNDDGAFLGSLIASLLVEERTHRPTAGDTTFRGTHAGKCLRALSYDIQGIEPTNPPNPSSLWMMLMGTLAHEVADRAILRRFPNAEIEVSVVDEGGDFSCHIDAVVEMTGSEAAQAWPTVDVANDRLLASAPPEVLHTIDPDAPFKVVWEIKSTQKYAFDQIVGTAKKAGEGPRLSDFLQGAMNATAAEADLLVVSYLTLGVTQSPSVEHAKQIGRDFVYTPDQFQPAARAELDRLQGALLEPAVLAPRSTPLMPEGALIVDPTRSLWTLTDDNGAILRSDHLWYGKFCNMYCDYYDQCCKDGA